MLLVAALETAQAGQKLLCASYGDGAHALLFETTDALDKLEADLTSHKTSLMEDSCATRPQRQDTGDAQEDPPQQPVALFRLPHVVKTTSTVKPKVR